ncbi:phosphotriesterase [Kitasatospora sp. NBC_00070]|uniref:phosphotriesterase family protein n=1 Tax=Kitasatospora sp. NBC_00070 TaxID=2975962 RepID=UPI0032478B81
MSTGLVRTVLGDVPAEELGAVDSHDHLFLRSAALPGQELDDARAAEVDLRAFRAAGGGTVVQWTPYGLGRRAEHLAALSRTTGVHVLAATGLHQALHYPPGVVRAVLRNAARLFIDELTVGLHDDDGSPLPARAALVKVAGGFHGLDEHARTVLAAAAEAHHATGAPIGAHLEQGTAAADVLALLCDDLSVPPQRVILGHLNRFPDLRLHREAAERGAYLAFDGPTRAHHATDWRLLDALSTLVEAGHGRQLLLGGDTTTARARSLAAGGEGPGMPHLLDGLRPRIARELGTDAAELLLVHNPARAFTMAAG